MQRGWIVPFGGLKKVKEFLEFYQDHVSLLGADDPRVENLPPELLQQGGVLGSLRVLPYGVSMEMTSLFLWEHIDPFIRHMTNGRCYVSRLQVWEHERNSGFVTVDSATSMELYNTVLSCEDEFFRDRILNLETRDTKFEFILPSLVLDALNGKFPVAQ